MLPDLFSSPGTGFEGDQNLGVQLIEFGKKKKQILHGDPLPLSRKSYLTWVGFSAEGEVVYSFLFSQKDLDLI